MGLFGGGNSSSTTQNTTNNFDKRVAVDSGFGLSGDGNSVSIMSNDAGIVARALDSVDRNNAIYGESLANMLDTSNSQFGQVVSANQNSFTQLLDKLTQMFNTSESLIGQTQKSIADAYNQAQTTAKGTIDNKTIIVLAVAGAVALVMISKKG